jgi:hypothetical protein
MTNKLTVATLLVFTFLCTAANAAVFPYSLSFCGPCEFPANTSPGTGSGTITYDDVAHTLAMNVNFSGLTGNTTAAHIHAPTTISGTFPTNTPAQNSAAMNANVATQLPSFVGFPLGVTSGSFSNTLDLTQSSSWNPAYISANGGTPAGAEAAFAATLSQGRAYFNIHTSQFTGGEIRAFPVLIPEPAGVLLCLLGIAVLGLQRRHK